MLHTNLGTQYMQAALTEWRSRNRWADDIPFERFPKKYRDEIETAASINAGGLPKPRRTRKKVVRRKKENERKTQSRRPR